MRRIPCVLILMCLAVATIQAASKPHVITFGKPVAAKFFLETNEAKSLEIRVRPLYVDGRLREFTTGEPHDITEQVFTVQRAYRVNDSLPGDERTLPKWKWQRGGWMLVDRRSGRVSPLKLPEFDPFYSAAAWYRDYAAYCGVSDTGEKLYAVVAQLGRKRPALRKELGAASEGELPDANCALPRWERHPARVTFAPHQGQKLTFDVHGRPADLPGTDTEVKDDESN
jgi:hypothetical protein